jgi:hypothetical protein
MELVAAWNRPTDRHGVDWFGSLTATVTAAPSTRSGASALDDGGVIAAR